MRKHFKHLIGALFFAVLFSTAHGQDAWKEYVHPEHQMAFSMPADPVESKQSIETALGPIMFYTYLLDHGTNALLVGMNEYPDSILQKSADAVLTGACNGNVNFFKAKLTSQSKISLDGHPGLAYEMANTNVIGKYRIYLVGTRLYQVGSVTSVGTSFVAGTDRFLNSFRLVQP